MKLLIKKYIEENLTKDERIVLIGWLNESEDNIKILKKEIITYKNKTFYDVDVESALTRFKNSIHDKKQLQKRKKRINFYKYAASIAGFLFMGFLMKFIFFSNTNNEEVLTSKTNNLSGSQTEIVLKLAGGNTLVLNDKASVKIKDVNGNLVVNQNESHLEFQKMDSLSDVVVYNEITVPYGKRIQLSLSDGSVVSLNSGSYFKFPQQFISSAKERKVFLRGEAFFDVSKDKNHPFVVEAGEIDVKVLGTKFNVSAYQNDDEIATTLVEGSVLVNSPNYLKQPIILIPNDQLRYLKSTKDVSKKIVDINLYTSWMDGKLIINNLTFEEILKILERRCNVKFNTVSKQLNKEVFKGEFTTESLEIILETMALSAHFSYTRNEDIITIKKDNRKE
jgi:transmembrane sensor